MTQANHPRGPSTAVANDSEVPFASNEVRLSAGQWMLAGIVLAALFYFLPVLWRRIEPLPGVGRAFPRPSLPSEGRRNGLPKRRPGSDYRVPYRLGNDYWIYRRYCRQACRRNSTLVVGDSVVWGHYVGKEQTLSAYLNGLTLNEWAGTNRFVNLGVDGIEPAAMAGLIEYYGGHIQGQNVVLHCNLLWTADKRRDLQTSKERPVTHPGLLPQFVPRIPCYKETFSRRLGIVVKRRFSFLAWADHLRIAYFGNTGLPRWTVDHPYANPLAEITLELPSPDQPPSPKPVAEPWTSQGIAPQAFPWVKLERSTQWRFFRRTVGILRGRGNRVFVLLGPFNEHLLTPESLATYRTRKAEAEAWLRKNRVAYDAPPALPSRHYADASHPLAAGYALLAKELLESESFVRFRSAGASSPRK